MIFVCCAPAPLKLTGKYSVTGYFLVYFIAYVPHFLPLFVWVIHLWYRFAVPSEEENNPHV